MKRNVLRMIFAASAVAFARVSVTPRPTITENPAAVSAGTGGEANQQGRGSQSRRGLASLSTQSDALLEQANRTGAVRVIVKLRIPYSKDVREKEALARQREAISHAQAAVLARLTEHKPVVLRMHRHIPYISLKVNAAALQRLLGMDSVEAVYEDHLTKPTLTQSTKIIDAQTAWNYGYGGQGYVVVVMDTGVAKNHRFLVGKIVDEACFSSDDGGYFTSLCPGRQSESHAVGSGLPCPDSRCDHGTHVAGIAAGWKGVAFSASIISMQVFTRINSLLLCSPAYTCVGSFESDQMTALEWLYEHTNNFVGVPVSPPVYSVAAVNLSLGGGQFNQNCDGGAMNDIVDRLAGVGVGVVAAAGNGGATDALSYPGCISTVISVGATDKQNRISSFSNRAAFLSVWAPGQAILSSVPGNGYATKSGTSMAAPHVAGALAIMRQCVPSLLDPAGSLAAIIQRIRLTGKTISNSAARRLEIGLAIEDSWAEFDASTTDYPAKLAVVGDFHGNGREEIAIVGQRNGSGGNDLWVGEYNRDTARWRNLPDIDVSTTGYPAKFAVAGDFDGNGRREIAMAPDRAGSGGNDFWVVGYNTSTSAWEHIRQPGTNFWADVDASATAYPAKFAVAGDFNGDGRDEIAIAPDRSGSGGNDFWVVGYNPSTTLGEHVRQPSSTLLADFDASGRDYAAKFAVAGDFDADGRREIAIAPARAGSGGNDFWVVGFQGGAGWVYLGPPRLFCR